MARLEPVPISALQHYLYCPRQCALIHLDQTYEENLYTLRGNRVHERVHEPNHDTDGDVHRERALPLHSETLGLVGQADEVEFQVDGTPYPVEFKAGTRRSNQADDVQLCAQAMCLETMLDRPVPRGSLYYHRTRRRRKVTFDDDLRRLVRASTAEVRRLLAQESLPEPVADARCRSCSLLESCMPHVVKDLRTLTPNLFVVGEPP